MSANQYLTEVSNLIARIERTQLDKIKQAASLFADRIREDRLLHILGAGHSSLVAGEMFARAGGLAPVNGMIDECVTLSMGARKSSRIEKLEGFAEVIWENHYINQEDLMLVVSNSGRNGLPIDIALKAKEEGLYLLAITSLDHSKNCASKHSSGKKLYEIADLVFDNCVPYGDGLLEYGDLITGPGSTLAGVVIVNSLLTETIKILQDQNITLPVYQSQNMDGVNNQDLFKKYDKRIKYL